MWWLSYKLPEILMQLLHIDSAITGAHSVSRQVADLVVAELQAHHPGAKTVVRDLAAHPLPHLTGEVIARARSDGTEGNHLPCNISRNRANNFFHRWLERSVVGMFVQRKAVADRHQSIGFLYGFIAKEERGGVNEKEKVAFSLIFHPKKSCKYRL